MGNTAQQPTVKLMLTSDDGRKLAETLIKNRNALVGVEDPVGKAQHDFLDQVLGTLQAALKAAEEAAAPAPTPTAATPAATPPTA